MTDTDQAEAVYLQAYSYTLCFFLAPCVLCRGPGVTPSFRESSFFLHTRYRARGCACGTVMLQIANKASAPASALRRSLSPKSFNTKGLYIPQAILSTMDQATDDRLAQLQRQIRSWRPLHPLYLYSPILCIAMGGVCSILRYYNGWSYEEAGILINLGFWGGYMGGAVLSVLVAMWGRRNARDFEDFMREFEGEKAKRNV